MRGAGAARLVARTPCPQPGAAPGRATVWRSSGATSSSSTGYRSSSGTRASSCPADSSATWGHKGAGAGVSHKAASPELGADEAAGPSGQTGCCLQAPGWLACWAAGTARASRRSPPTRVGLVEQWHDAPSGAHLCPDGGRQVAQHRLLV